MGSDVDVTSFQLAAKENNIPLTTDSSCIKEVSLISNSTTNEDCYIKEAYLFDNRAVIVKLSQQIISGDTLNGLIAISLADGSTKYLDLEITRDV